MEPYIVKGSRKHGTVKCYMCARRIFSGENAVGISTVGTKAMSYVCMQCALTHKEDIKEYYLYLYIKDKSEHAKGLLKKVKSAFKFDVIKEK